jgi:hypothetical protein
MASTTSTTTPTRSTARRRGARSARRRGARSALAGIVLAFVVAAIGAAAANACLGSGAVGPVAADAPVARVALAALADTVRRIEPAFPRTVIASRLPVDEDDPLREDLRYLRERNLTPRDLTLEDFDRATWQRLIDALTGWYGLPPRPVGPADSPAAVLADLERAVQRIVATVRPVALLAWDPDDEDRLAFVGVIWNWSPYPRLIVSRPPEGWTMSAGARALAERINVCGARVSDFVAASAPVARALFLSNNTATMYLVGSEPETASAWPYQVPAGEEVDVFDFTHPEVRDLEAFSAVFVGDPLALLSMVRLLPAVRTNLSPFGLMRVMQTPPRRD